MEKFEFCIKAVVQKCSVKKVFLEISQNSHEITCARVSFLIKLQVWSATLLKKRLWHRCFPVNFVKFLRTPFFIEHLWWLLLLYPVLVLKNSLKGSLLPCDDNLEIIMPWRSLKPRKTSSYNSIALSIAKEDADVSFGHWKRRIAVVCRCSSKSCS